MSTAHESTMDAPKKSNFPHIPPDEDENTAAEQQEHYEHALLLENDFRILELLPGEFDDPINVELTHQPMHTDDGKDIRIHYEALSYTWGHPTPTEPILCHGKVVNLRENLYQALQHIRLTDKKRYIWADAICIDQFNIPERNQHVQRMDQVFCGADRVLVWLGEENRRKEGKKVLDVLPEWLAAYPPHIDWNAAKIRWDMFAPTFTFSREGLSKEAIDWLAYQQKHLRHMLHFFARLWWNRRWVIQEVVQAKEAILICGEEEIPWAIVNKFLSSEQKQFSLWHDGLARIFDKYPDKAFIANANNGIFNSRQLARMASTFGTPDALTLWNILYETNDFRCTDPRDNLYSVFAVAPDVRDCESTALLKVDYSDPIRKISTNYSCWLLRYDPYALIGFRTLNGVRGCSSDIPSWVPNIVPTFWMKRPDLRRPLSVLSLDSGRLATYPRPIWSLKSDSHILSIKGVITETVTAIEPPPYVDISEYGWLHFGKDHAHWVKRCYDLVAKSTKDDQDAINLMYLLLTCGGEKTCGADARDWQSPTVEICKRWLEVLFNACADESDNDPDVESDPDLSNMTRAFVYAKWRQFCVTSEGRFGWVPEPTRIGDKICILLGAKLPLSVGECGKGHYNVMGEGYIQGLMDGEALEMGLEEQMIDLC